MDQTVLDWLMASDPAIRWQVMRDILGAPSSAVAAERARIASEGMGARLLGMRGMEPWMELDEALPHAAPRPGAGPGGTTGLAAPWPWYETG